MQEEIFSLFRLLFLSLPIYSWLSFMSGRRFQKEEEEEEKKKGGKIALVCNFATGHWSTLLAQLLCKIFFFFFSLLSFYFTLLCVSHSVTSSWKLSFHRFYTYSIRFFFFFYSSSYFSTAGQDVFNWIATPLYSILSLHPHLFLLLYCNCYDCCWEKKQNCWIQFNLHTALTLHSEK